MLSPLRSCPGCHNYTTLDVCHACMEWTWPLTEEQEKQLHGGRIMKGYVLTHAPVLYCHCQKGQGQRVPACYAADKGDMVPCPECGHHGRCTSPRWWVIGRGVELGPYAWEHEARVVYDDLREAAQHG